MGQRLDLHVHTKRHSACSSIEPHLLINRALKSGLDGIVITEHHYQWEDEELERLLDEAERPDFVLLAGFEYTSSQGDILIYGLEPGDANSFLKRGHPPEIAVTRARELGGVCIAAHPTREGLGFDDRLETLDVAAIEVGSVNLRDHEQMEAEALVHRLQRRPVASSDAHNLTSIGTYWAEFDPPVYTRAELRQALRHGTFKPSTAFV